jgi:hypothetical protein
VHAYSAQDANQPYYDPDTRTLVIQMANPHLRSVGTVATGSYEAFIPNAMLTGAMGVPDPASLTGGSFVVSRSTTSTPTPVPFTLTHTTTGVQIRISDITFSSPTYRIRPKPMRPGPPRLRSVVRSSSTTATIRFLAPLANGGRPILRYVAGCSARRHPLVSATGTRSPLVIRGLVRGTTYACTVRAVNAIGAGRAPAARIAIVLAH